MTLNAGPPMTRRRLKETGETEIVAPTDVDEAAPVIPDDDTDAEASGSDLVRPARGSRPAARPALTWVDPDTVGPRGQESLIEGDLLARRPHRSPLRPGIIVPFLAVIAVFALYAATTLLWPLNALPPTVATVPVTPIAAPVSTPLWPTAGTGAVAVEGIDGSTAALTGDPVPIASITKVVTALMVLEEMPLAVGEQGPEFQFDYSDENDYYDYLDQGESALDVPVDGTLTELQLLQGMLIGSANNYADRLAGNLWPNDEVFANAAEDWLTAHGIAGMTIVEPSGIEGGNSATPVSLITLAQRALANPVIAGIVATPVIELPGAGVVTNTNELLADPGVVGVKTGTLDGYNLLAAKDVTIGATTVRMYVDVLNQPDDVTRFAAARALFDQMTAELQLRPSVTAGTAVGVVQTAWGATADILTSTDASVILYNGGVATVTPDLGLGDDRSADDVVGSVTVVGPLDTAVVDAHLSSDIEGPSGWWRLTHPLELFGLAG